MSDTASAATEIVADVAEEVAEQATQIAEVSRGMTGRSVSMLFGGFVVGAGVGGTLVYIFSQRKFETKYSQMAGEEIASMREHYAQKALAAEANAGKRDLRELVEERGYTPAEDEEPEELDTSQPPMAVAPPKAVVEAAQESEQEDVPAEPIETNIFRDVAEDRVDVEYEWIRSEERARRSPDRPYVIHVDEKDEIDTYDQVTYTYYEEDDVLCNETDEVIDKDARERLVGDANLERFGHGSGDSEVVFIRNDQMEMIIEVNRSPNSYLEEVHGLQHSEEPRRRGRVSFDDD